MDNVLIERLWRSLKYEDVYLKGYADGCEAARGIAEWVAFYNDRRPHQALADRMPMAVWREAIVGARAVDMMDNASALPTCPQPNSRRSLLLADRKESGAVALPTKNLPQTVPMRGSSSELRWHDALLEVAPTDSRCISLADCARQGHSKQSERQRKHNLAHKECRAMI